MYKSHNFEMYDFGKKRNQQKYGQDSPPAINLKEII